MTSTDDAFYLRYYSGHSGRFGHEFLEFDFKILGDGRSAMARYANNSNYRNDSLIRKEMCVSAPVVAEIKKIIKDSEIMKEDDTKWPQKNKDGRQELEICIGKQHISFETAKIGSLAEISDSQDPDGLRVFYYLVQDLRAFVFSLISLHFKLLRELDQAYLNASGLFPAGSELTPFCIILQALMHAASLVSIPESTVYITGQTYPPQQYPMSSESNHL